MGSRTGPQGTVEFFRTIKPSPEMNPRKIEEKTLEVWRSLDHIFADCYIVDHGTADYLIILDQFL